MKMDEKLKQVIDRLVVDMQQEGTELTYNVNLYASKNGMNATIQLSIMEKQDVGTR